MKSHRKDQRSFGFRHDDSHVSAPTQRFCWLGLFVRIDDARLSVSIVYPCVSIGCIPPVCARLQANCNGGFALCHAISGRRGGPV